MATKSFNEATIAHLNLLQGIISRLASNSFSLKALAATISAAIIALMGAQSKTMLALPIAALRPVIVFWLLDAKYLQTEKLFRHLYDDVRTGKSEDPFGMNIKPYEEKVPSTLALAFTWSVIWFYAAIVMGLATLAFMLKP